ncbi:outer membrane lipoprotein carrier protein LolA [Chitinivorax sp. PXF-14]|uniref:outer membrane lipoprotein carrier protein LolA n=1 Tax=Chitinivorax sp. PXF-14 TaxID=3230488 RepID=UPI003465336E
MTRRVLYPLWLTASLLAMPAARAAGDIDKIQPLLARPDVVCGQFQQAKTLLGLKNPVKSSGRFCVVPGKGVLWRTVRPFPSELRLARDEIVESQGGQVVKRLSAQQEPAIRMINGLLFSLLAGDLRQLDALFELKASTSGRDWQAQLAPRDANLKRVIAAISLSGADTVRRVAIVETSGDRTDIDFSATSQGRAAFQGDEAKQFD